ncbi:hypothetical protein AKJ16_DCAP23240 [Drosera capensis]
MKKLKSYYNEHELKVAILEQSSRSKESSLCADMISAHTTSCFGYFLGPSTWRKFSLETKC